MPLLVLAEGAGFFRPLKQNQKWMGCRPGPAFATETRPRLQNPPPYLLVQVMSTYFSTACFGVFDEPAKSWKAGTPRAAATSAPRNRYFKLTHYQTAS